MKKLMIACCMIAGGLWAKCELAATAEVASFGDLSKKVPLLGSMISNPIVPTLLLGTGQQQLAQTYGRFRSDSPLYLQFYVGEPCEQVLVYPSADGVAKMVLNNPGTEKLDDGTLHITANGDDRWVKFSADGKYCSIAPSADLARRAIADFEATAAARNSRMNTVRPVIRLDVLPKGLEFLVETQKKVECAKADKAKAQGNSALLQKLLAIQDKKDQSTILRKISGATLLLDLNADGISADFNITPKPGIRLPVIAGRGLPAGALDAMTADASLFYAAQTLFQGAYQWDDEAEFKDYMNEIAGIFRTDVVAEIKNSKELKKYSAALTEVVRAVADLIAGAEYPAADDWSAVALTFDAERRPAVLSDGRARNAQKICALSTQLMDRLTATLAKQWPGSKIIEKTSASHVIDWGEAIDVGIAESGLSKGDGAAKAAKNAKQTVKQILGSTKTEVVSTVAGSVYKGHFAIPGYVRTATPGVGEKRVAEALPEITKERPGMVFYLPLYCFARDVVLPVMSKQASKQDARQYATLIEAMPQPEANSAIAMAGWVRKDGTTRMLLRITANEVKNYGAVFNAFTAASMAGGVSDDDE